MADSPDLLDMARRVAGAARDHEQVEAYVARSHETEVRVFDGDVESLSVAGIDGVGVRVVVDHRQGYAWAGSLDPEVVDETVAEARDNAAFGEPDEWYGLAAPSDLGDVAPVELDVWREELLAVPTDDKVALALEVERATRAVDARVRGVEFAGYDDTAIEAAVANSLGVESTTRRTLCNCSAVAMAGDHDATQTGVGFSAGRTVADLDVGEAAGDAAERALRLLGATQPPSRRLPVILDPLVTRSLLGIVGAALGGEAVLKGRSMFVGREDEEVAAPNVTLVDDPTRPEAFGAAGYDSEGVPTRRTELIAGGRLAGFLHNVYTARRSGGATTGSAARGGFKSAPGVAARALHLEPGPLTAPEVLASVPEALYVQEVSGLHSGTNPVSGDFSVGVEGLIVRDGAFAEPVREVTIASTLQRILLDVGQVGADLTWLPGGAAGVTLLVSEMTMSGG
ncbi:MAG: TldD/PmbA family protein [Actinobacteria bacterium]|nr:TldD/PmbA family protein [Actinomycetota bacterium]